MFGPKEIQFFGTGQVGEKGQVVIPIKARNKLAIKPGDNFIFFSHGKLMHMIKSDELNTVLEEISRNFTKNICNIKKEIKDNIK